MALHIPAHVHPLSFKTAQRQGVAHTIALALQHNDSRLVSQTPLAVRWLDCARFAILLDDFSWLQYRIDVDSCKPVQCGSLAALPSSEIAVLAGTPVCAEAAGRQYGESLVMALEDRRLLLLQDALLPLGGDQGSGSAPAPRGQVLARLTVGKRVERLSVSSDRGHVMLETKDHRVAIYKVAMTANNQRFYPRAVVEWMGGALDEAGWSWSATSARRFLRVRATNTRHSASPLRVEVWELPAHSSRSRGAAAMLVQADTAPALDHSADAARAASQASTAKARLLGWARALEESHSSPHDATAPQPAPSASLAAGSWRRRALLASPLALQIHETLEADSRLYSVPWLGLGVEARQGSKAGARSSSATAASVTTGSGSIGTLSEATMGDDPDHAFFLALSWPSGALLLQLPNHSTQAAWHAKLTTLRDAAVAASGTAGSISATGAGSSRSASAALRTATSARVAAVGWCPHEDTVVIAFERGVFVLYDAAQRVFRRTELALRSPPRLVRWHPDGGLLLCALQSGRLLALERTLRCVDLSSAGSAPQGGGINRVHVSSPNAGSSSWAAVVSAASPQRSGGGAAAGGAGGGAGAGVSSTALASTLAPFAASTLKPPTRANGRPVLCEWMPAEPVHVVSVAGRHRVHDARARAVVVYDGGPVMVLQLPLGVGRGRLGPAQLATQHMSVGNMSAALEVCAAASQADHVYAATACLIHQLCKSIAGGAKACQQLVGCSLERTAAIARGVFDAAWAKTAQLGFDGHRVSLSKLYRKFGVTLMRRKLFQEALLVAVDMRSAPFLNEIASWAKSAGHGAIAVTAARAAAQLSEAEAAEGGTPSAGAEIAAKVAWWADRAQPMLQAVARVESGGNAYDSQRHISPADLAAVRGALQAASGASQRAEGTLRAAGLSGQAAVLHSLRRTLADARPPLVALPRRAAGAADSFSGASGLHGARSARSR